MQTKCKRRRQRAQTQPSCPHPQPSPKTSPDPSLQIELPCGCFLKQHLTLLWKKFSPHSSLIFIWNRATLALSFNFRNILTFTENRFQPWFHTRVFFPLSLLLLVLVSLQKWLKGPGCLIKIVWIYLPLQHRDTICCFINGNHLPGN